MRALSARQALIVVAVGLVCACAGTRERPEVGELGTEGDERAQSFQGDRIDPLRLVAGARVFDERCSPCHGERGDGDGVLAEMLPIRPRNYQADAFKWGTSPSEIVTTIRVGRSGVMPAFEGAISEDQMWDVAYLVWHWIPPERRHLRPSAKR